MRSRLQFSLRSLLLFTLFLSVFLFPLSDWLYRKRCQRAAIAAIRAVGGRFYYDWEINDAGGVRTAIQGARPPGPAWVRGLCGDDFFGEVVIADLSRGERANVTDAWLMKLVPLTSLDTLALDRTNVTDAGLVHLRPFRKLVRLSLDGTRIGGPELVELANLPSLRWLSLAETPVDDESLRYLKNCRSLEQLNLSNTKVRGSGLASLADLPRLTELDLSSTKVTREGLTSLADLPRLRELDLSSTKVTREGLTSLAALKRLRILWLHDATVDDGCLGALSDVASLRVLSVSTDRITKAGLLCLTRLPKLKQLLLVAPRETEESDDLSAPPRVAQHIDLAWLDSPEGEALQAMLPRCEVVPVSEYVNPKGQLLQDTDD